MLLEEVAEEYGDARLERCRAFMQVPGPLQTVQRAEFWSAIMALQAYWPRHLGVDTLKVVTARLLEHGKLSKPSLWFMMEILLLLISM